MGMYESIEKGYYLKKTEWWVLLLLAGVKKFYTFSMPEAEETKEEAVTQALYQLAKSGWIMTEEQLQLTSQCRKEIMEPLLLADYALALGYSQTQTPKIWYLSRETVMMTEEVGEEIRICKWDYDRLWNAFDEALPPNPLIDNEEGELIKKFEPQAAEEYEKLGYAGKETSSRPLLHAAREMKSQSGWEIVDLKGQKTAGRFFFCPGGLNFWILKQSEDEAEVVFDSIPERENLKKTIRNILGIKENGGN